MIAIGIAVSMPPPSSFMLAAVYTVATVVALDAGSLMIIGNLTLRVNLGISVLSESMMQSLSVRSILG